MSQLKPYRTRTHSLRPRSYTPRADDRRLVAEVRRRAAVLVEQTDAELAALMHAVRDRVLAGTSFLDRDIVCSVFSLVCEAARRKLKIQYYDVQLLAGMVLATGSIAEMKTGEGKTLVTALPASLAGLAPGGAHVATVNSYLARRDYETLQGVFRLLGLSVGLLTDDDTPQQKRAAYRQDITYGTGYEFGFDYLRDQLALQTETRLRLGQRFLHQLRGGAAASSSTVQGDLAFAIIDEVDSVLIDEANTPLIISGPTDGITDAAVYQQAKELTAGLRQDLDFVIDRRHKRVILTDEGLERVFAEQPRGILRPWSVYIEQALQVQHLLQKNVDYVVQDAAVKIVDQYTGRIFAERTWRDGLHQAVEAKEGAAITEERRSVARVSRQQFYQQYRFICGMTGTALGHQAELERFYRLPIVTIPLRKACRRQKLATRFFATSEAKLDAVAADILRRSRSGQPILVGTRTIAASLQLSDRLQAMNLGHQVLNGIQDEEEAALVAQAGRAGAVTVATNMAGRGTDIKLTEESRRAGGLHVISLEYHDSARVDRQLEGRTARQGDPGSAQFFVSATDELLSRHDPPLAEAMARAAGASGEAMGDFEHAILQVQRRAEHKSYQQRCRVYQQQQWLDKVLTTVAEPTRKAKHRSPAGEAVTG